MGLPELLLLLSLLSEELTPELDVTSPTLLEPSMLPRGRLMLMPTTWEDTELDMPDSDTPVSDTPVSDTLVLDMLASDMPVWDTTLSDELTPELDVTSPTLLEPSTSPRGRLMLMPTTWEDTELDTPVSDTLVLDMLVSDTLDSDTPVWDMPVWDTTLSDTPTCLPLPL